MKTIEVPVYTLTGEKKGTQPLDPAVFSVAFKDPVVHQAIRVQRANRRTAIANTKGRGEVRGGGKKPWKQKGTGRARHGSRRSPIWVGGGITFGPTKERNFSLSINKKMRQQALRMILSDKVAHDRLVVVEAWATINSAKTKKLGTALASLPSKQKKTLIVTTPKDSVVIRSARNLPKVTSIGVGSLNVLDLLAHEYVVVPKDLISIIEKRYR